MKKILLTIQYNGEHFHGWQKQPNKPTVQEVLENAISFLLKENITLYASGRTDSGVSAFKQTAHFETSSNFDVKKLAQAINANINQNISVLSAKYVNNNFHARFSVKKKTYLYKTYASQTTCPILEKSAVKVSENILENLENIKEASKHFLGTHNFLAFCASRTDAKDFVKTIYEIKIKKQKNSIDFYITGSGFLYNMVRIIIGTLIAVGEGKILPENIPEIIKSQERKNAGKTMPAKGLYLFDVKY